MAKLSVPLTYIINVVIKKLYNFDVWWTAWKHEKPAKECADIQARGPGHLLGLPNG